AVQRGEWRRVGGIRADALHQHSALNCPVAAPQARPARPGAVEQDGAAVVEVDDGGGPSEFPQSDRPCARTVAAVEVELAQSRREIREEVGEVAGADDVDRVIKIEYAWVGLDGERPVAGHAGAEQVRLPVGESRAEQSA